MTNQQTFEDYLARQPVFNGDDVDMTRDGQRLTGQILRVYNLMRDGNWRTLDEIASSTNDPHASISAQLRNLRKSRFGSHIIEREHIGNGLYKYRLETKRPS